MIRVADPQYLRAIHPDHEKAHLARRDEDPSRRSRNARTTRVTARSQSNGLIRDGPYAHVSVRDHETRLVWAHRGICCASMIAIARTGAGMTRDQVAGWVAAYE